MSVNILFDECLPKKLKYRIEELDPHFDVFVISDRDLSFQQPIQDTKIHVFLLIASTNIYEDLLPLVEKLRAVYPN